MLFAYFDYNPAPVAYKFSAKINFKETIYESLRRTRNIGWIIERRFGKFYDGGNKAAGTRVRKGMLELKNFAQEVRVEVQEIKNKE